MSLFDVVLLLCVVTIAALFWRWRQQAEHAAAHAQRYCQQHRLQLLEIHRLRTRYRRDNGRWGWYSEFAFDFSSDHESRYQGMLLMRNLQLSRVDTPVYRTLAED